MNFKNLTAALKKFQKSSEHFWLFRNLLQKSRKMCNFAKDIKIIQQLNFLLNQQNF